MVYADHGRSPGDGPAGISGLLVGQTVAYRGVVYADWLRRGLYCRGGSFDSHGAERKPAGLERLASQGVRLGQTRCRLKLGTERAFTL